MKHTNFQTECVFFICCPVFIVFIIMKMNLVLKFTSVTCYPWSIVITL